MEPAEKNITVKPKRKWLKIALWIFGSVMLVIGLLILGLTVYINNHKSEVLAKVTEKLNENLDGELAIGDLSPEFFSNFPRVSLRLKNVTLHDKRYGLHKKEFLNARNIDITVNAMALVRMAVKIEKISVRDATISLFVDRDGYSNASVFRKKGKSKGGATAMECRQFELDNVRFKAENLMRSKRHDFEIHTLDGKIKPAGKGWHSDIAFSILARSMSFNTDKGSFIKDQPLVGRFDLDYDGNGKFDFIEEPLKIGKENFSLAVELDFSEGKSTYKFRIKNKSILWKDAANLLSDNIRTKLLQFGIEKPIEVRCELDGDFNIADDPLIYVEAKVRGNKLSTPGGAISNCSFDGVFANNYNKKRPLGDANSVILLRNLSGEYGSVPFQMPVAAISNLDNPTARGKFTSNFDLPKLNGLIDKSLIDIKSGRADIAVDFTADVTDNQLARPRIVGKIAITKAGVAYTQRNLAFEDVSVNLDFNPKDLYIRNIHIKTGHTDVVMDGKVENFLNLYYNSPDKIVLNWNVYSKQLDLGEFLGYLGSNRQKTRKVKRTGNFTTEMNELFEKCQVRMAMKIDKLFFKKFHATHATAVVSISDDRILVKNTGLNHSGGRVQLSGTLNRFATYNRYSFLAGVKEVNVKHFFEAFDNFGLKALKADNLSGTLSLDAELSGAMASDNRLLQKTMGGKASFVLKNGTLTNFEPIQKVGKIAFRRRDINNIAFKDLNGTFKIEGEKVTVEPMKISSSVLNLDVEGVYSFGKGTDLRIDVPLRNPKKDEEILDKQELEKRRHRGIVLHLQAADDAETGKVKISLKGKKDDTEN